MINNFWAVRDDISFTEQLYRRGELATKLKVAMESGSTVYPLDGEILKFRSGISPATHNVTNIRHKSKPVFVKEEVSKVE